MKTKVIEGNNIDILKGYPDNYFDSIVTDPPYGIEFLSKDWDKNTGAIETWEQCFRVLKPGGYILAFSAARTYHNLATNIESVGFEIRDQLMWLYASGFPKAQDVGKALNKRGVKNKLEGWKTALKPAHEPIVMARKPFKGSGVDNVLKWGVGALNIDATRIDWEDGEQEKEQKWREKYGKGNVGGPTFKGTNFEEQKRGGEIVDAPPGRFPSNVLGEVEGYQKFFYCPKVSRAERHCGFEAPEPEPFNNPEDMKKHPLWDPSIGTNSHRLMTKIREHQKNNPLAHIPTNPDGMFTGFYENGESNETGGSYINKPKGIYTTGDAMRELGGRWENQKTAAGIKAVAVDKDGNTIPQVTLQAMVESKASGNNHPTVKPVALMRYLIKLVTPQGGKILDPFTGSGSTGMAAVELDYDFTGCELDPDYVHIAETRINAWKNKTDLENNPLPEQWFEEE